MEGRGDPRDDTHRLPAVVDGGPSAGIPRVTRSKEGVERQSAPGTAPVIVDPGVVEPVQQSVLCTVTMADAAGLPLPSAPAAVLENPLNPSSRIVLLPARRLLGVAHCTISDASSQPVALRKVSWRTADGVLVALELPAANKRVSWDVTASSFDNAMHGWNLPMGGRSLTPVQVEEIRWSVRYMSEVGRLGAGGWPGLFLDDKQQLAGFVLPDEDGTAGSGFVLAVNKQRLSRVDAVDMSLIDFVELTFGNDASLLVRQARQHLAARRFSQAIFTFHRALDARPELLIEISGDLLLAHRGALSTSVARSRARVRLDLLEAALMDFPDEVSFLQDQAKTARAGQEFLLAWSAWQKAHALDAPLVGDLPAIAADLFLEWAQWLERSALIEESIGILRDGIVEAGNDEEILIMLARLLLKKRAYTEVAFLLRDALFQNPDLSETLGDTLARAERMQDRPGNVVIDYPPGARSIHATVFLNGVAGEFIVDTGASTTMVPDDLARRANLDTGPAVPRVRLRTAGDERVVPFSPCESLSVGGLSVTGLSVVVGDLRGMGNLGLLGMDFLGRFGFENDSVNGRFVIYAR